MNHNRVKKQVGAAMSWAGVCAICYATYLWWGVAGAVLVAGVFLLLEGTAKILIAKAKEESK